MDIYALLLGILIGRCIPNDTLYIIIILIILLNCKDQNNTYVINCKKDDKLLENKVNTVDRPILQNDITLAQLMKKSFQGVNITAFLLNGTKITGEVVDGFNNILILKSEGMLNYIDVNAIVSFS